MKLYIHNLVEADGKIGEGQIQRVKRKLESFYSLVDNQLVEIFPDKLLFDSSTLSGVRISIEVLDSAAKNRD